MKHFFLFVTLMATVAVLGDFYSTFDGYIPEGNAAWYSSVPQGENDVVRVEDTWWHQFCTACAHYGVHHLLLKDIDKVWGHPSIAGMTAICDQLTEFVNSLE